VNAATHHEDRSSRTKHKKVLWTLFSALVCLIALAALTTVFVPISSDSVRERLVAFLSDKLDSDVELGSISLRTFPGVHIDATSLVIRPKGHPEMPPRFEIRHFAVDANAMDIWHKHVRKVTLDGLTINIVPQPDDRPHADGGAPGATVAKAGYVIDHLESKDARLAIWPDERGKAPKVWAIHRLSMQDVAIGESMPFQATLTNAVPPGEIETSGTFGPWQPADPGKTPLHGQFVFSRADLDVFHGIGGTLAAHGTFGRSLDHIDVNGETETPDFVIRESGHPFALHARYHAIVDGTNGDTILDRIDASFLQSSLVAKGKVVDANKDKPGRTVTLDITMDHARVEDVMTMAVKTPQPPLTGGLKMHTAFVLPPGESDVIDRLRLNGRFFMSNARFTRIDVQKKINELSHRSRGKTNEEATVGVVSNFQGEFRLAHGTLALPAFTFAVPGAVVKLAGRYALKSERIDFKGDLLMEAKVSETQSGLKRLLLKVVDPLFSKSGGGSDLPIKISGKRDDPDFGLDMGRVFHRGS
jgi:hypothetical protein